MKEKLRRRPARESASRKRSLFLPATLAATSWCTGGWKTLPRIFKSFLSSAGRPSWRLKRWRRSAKRRASAFRPKPVLKKRKNFPPGRQNSAGFWRRGPVIFKGGFFRKTTLKTANLKNCLPKGKRKTGRLKTVSKAEGRMFLPGD